MVVECCTVLVVRHLQHSTVQHLLLLVLFLITTWQQLLCRVFFSCVCSVIMFRLSIFSNSSSTHTFFLLPFVFLFHIIISFLLSLRSVYSRGSSQEFTNKVITLWYRPPELLLGATRYGFAVDIWSAGCILAELVLGRPLFTGKTEMDQLQLIFDMVGTPNSKSWPGVKDLKLLRTGDVTLDGDANRKRPKLRERYQSKMNFNAPGAINLVEKLLELDPSKRLTASRALNHRYFLQEPRAPDQPESLGEMKLAEGGSFHEFQTKKKRKEAKVEAEKIKQAALDGGHTVKQAQEEYDACYRGIMEKVALEGLVSTVAVAANKSATNAAAKNNGSGTDKNRRPKAAEGEHREKQREERAVADQDGHEDRHSTSASNKHRSSRSDRSLERRTTASRSSRGNDYRDLASRGRERRSREQSGDGNDKIDHEKIRDGSGTIAASTSKEAGSTHRERERDRDRDHSKERSRTSRASELDDRRKKRRRDSAGEDMERSTHSKRDKDKERHREHRKAPKVESGKSEKQSERIHSTSERTKEAKISNENVPTDDRSLHKESVQKSESSKRKDSIDTGNGGKSKERKSEASQSLRDKQEEGPSKDGPTGIERPDEKEESKHDPEKQPDNDHHPRSTSSRGDKKRSDRSRDRSREDRRDRDGHRRRSSKDRDGRNRDGDRSSSGRTSSSKRRKSRARSRSPERAGSPGRDRDDRHRRDRDHSRHERDRERRPHHEDDIRGIDRGSRNDRDRHRHPQHDDWGPGMMGGRGHPAAMQRRGGDFGVANHPNNADFDGPQQHHRHDHHHPRGGNNSGPYGPGGGGGERGPSSRGGDGRGGGHPGDFHGPPGRHPGDGNNRGGPPHQHPHGGRHPPPMDYYPPGGDHPPTGFRDRDNRRGGRRDRDRR